MFILFEFNMFCTTGSTLLNKNNEVKNIPIYFYGKIKLVDWNCLII